MPDLMICTIGHSNRPIEDFIGLLWSNEVASVIDVRTIPKSRHNPQFNLDALRDELADGCHDVALILCKPEVPMHGSEPNSHRLRWDPSVVAA